MFGVDGNVMAGVGAIIGGHLEPGLACGAKDEQGLTVLETMEALEDVDATERDPLSGATVMAGIGDPGEQPTQESAHGGIA
jgi:hypothetical protein